MMQQFQGLASLVAGTVEHTIDLVEHLQHAAWERQLSRFRAVAGIGPLLQGLHGFCQSSSRAVFPGIRGTSRLLALLVDRSLCLAARHEPVNGEGDATDSSAQCSARDHAALVAALNGAFGDHLRRTQNPLDLSSV